jgi:hypothetical protein
MTEHNGHMTEGTNYMVDYLANSEKLKPKDQRWYPTNNNQNDDEIDDNFNEYVTHNDIPMNQNTETNYNSGNTQQQNTYDEKSEQNNQTVQGGSQSNGSINKFIDEEYEMLPGLEKRLRRLDIMRALGELRDLGCKVTNYNIDDDYYMMKYELDLHKSIRSKRNWLGLYSHMLVGVIKGAELLNNNYNPFDFKLSGLSDEVSADKNTYYEILGEIYEFHNVPGKKMNPWFRLMISLIGVVVVVGGKNNAHKFMPNRSNKVENDEDYIENLRARAAKDSQSKGSQQNNKKNNQESNQQKNNLDEYMNKQHEHAVQRAKDIEDLKKQELEYQNYQQMLAQQKDKFNDIKKNLELTASPSARSTVSPSARSSVRSSTRSLSKKELQKSQKQKVPSDTMSEMSTSTNATNATNTTNATSQSGVSQISINNNLAKRLNNQLNNKSRKSTDISMDQISFGSNKKK